MPLAVLERDAEAEDQRLPLGERLSRAS
jgi:hypothetical protein